MQDLNEQLSLSAEQAEKAEELIVSILDDLACITDPNGTDAEIKIREISSKIRENAALFALAKDQDGNNLLHRLVSSKADEGLRLKIIEVLMLEQPKLLDARNKQDKSPWVCAGSQNPYPSNIDQYLTKSALDSNKREVEKIRARIKELKENPPSLSDQKVDTAHLNERMEVVDAKVEVMFEKLEKEKEASSKSPAKNDRYDGEIKNINDRMSKFVGDANEQGTLEEEILDLIIENFSVPGKNLVFNEQGKKFSKKLNDLEENKAKRDGKKIIKDLKDLQKEIKAVKIINEILADLKAIKSNNKDEINSALDEIWENIKDKDLETLKNESGNPLLHILIDTDDVDEELRLNFVKLLVGKKPGLLAVSNNANELPWIYVNQESSSQQISAYLTTETLKFRCANDEKNKAKGENPNPPQNSYENNSEFNPEEKLLGEISALIENELLGTELDQQVNEFYARRSVISLQRAKVRNNLKSNEKHVESLQKLKDDINEAISKAKPQPFEKPQTKEQIKKAEKFINGIFEQLDDGGDINIDPRLLTAKGHNGNTLLHRLVMRNGDIHPRDRLKVIKAIILFSSKSKSESALLINAKNNKQQSPLQLMLEESKDFLFEEGSHPYEMIKCLLDNGADLKFLFGDNATAEQSFRKMLPAVAKFNKELNNLYRNPKFKPVVPEVLEVKKEDPKVLKVEKGDLKFPKVLVEKDLEYPKHFSLGTKPGLTKWDKFVMLDKMMFKDKNLLSQGLAKINQLNTKLKDAERKREALINDKIKIEVTWKNFSDRHEILKKLVDSSSLKIESPNLEPYYRGEYTNESGYKYYEADQNNDNEEQQLENIKAIVDKAVGWLGRYEIQVKVAFIKKLKIKGDELNKLQSELNPEAKNAEIKSEAVSQVPSKQELENQLKEQIAELVKKFSVKELKQQLDDVETKITAATKNIEENKKIASEKGKRETRLNKSRTEVQKKLTELAGDIEKYKIFDETHESVNEYQQIVDEVNKIKEDQEEITRSDSDLQKSLNTIKGLDTRISKLSKKINGKTSEAGSLSAVISAKAKPFVEAINKALDELDQFAESKGFKKIDRTPYVDGIIDPEKLGKDKVLEINLVVSRIKVKPAEEIKSIFAEFPGCVQKIKDEIVGKKKELANEKEKIEKIKIEKEQLAKEKELKAPKEKLKTKISELETFYQKYKAIEDVDTPVPESIEKEYQRITGGANAANDLGTIQQLHTDALELCKKMKGEGDPSTLSDDRLFKFFFSKIEPLVKPFNEALDQLADYHGGSFNRKGYLQKIKSPIGDIPGAGVGTQGLLSGILTTEILKELPPEITKIFGKFSSFVKEKTTELEQKGKDACEEEKLKIEATHKECLEKGDINKAQKISLVLSFKHQLDIVQERVNSSNAKGLNAKELQGIHKGLLNSLAVINEGLTAATRDRDVAHARCFVESKKYLENFSKLEANFEKLSVYGDKDNAFQGKISDIETSISELLKFTPSLPLEELEKTEKALSEINAKIIGLNQDIEKELKKIEEQNRSALEKKQYEELLEEIKGKAKESEEILIKIKVRVGDEKDPWIVPHQKEMADLLASSKKTDVSSEGLLKIKNAIVEMIQGSEEYLSSMPERLSAAQRSNNKIQKNINENLDKLEKKDFEQYEKFSLEAEAIANEVKKAKEMKIPFSLKKLSETGNKLKQLDKSLSEAIENIEIAEKVKKEKEEKIQQNKTTAEGLKNKLGIIHADVAQKTNALPDKYKECRELIIQIQALKNQIDSADDADVIIAKNAGWETEYANIKQTAEQYEKDIKQESVIKELKEKIEATLLNIDKEERGNYRGRLDNINAVNIETLAELKKRAEKLLNLSGEIKAYISFQSLNKEDPEKRPEKKPIKPVVLANDINDKGELVGSANKVTVEDLFPSEDLFTDSKVTNGDSLSGTSQLPITSTFAFFAPVVALPEEVRKKKIVVKAEPTQPNKDVEEKGDSSNQSVVETKNAPIIIPPEQKPKQQDTRTLNTAPVEVKKPLSKTPAPVSDNKEPKPVNQNANLQTPVQTPNRAIQTSPSVSVTASNASEQANSNSATVRQPPKTTSIKKVLATFEAKKQEREGQSAVSKENNNGSNSKGDNASNVEKDLKQQLPPALLPRDSQMPPALPPRDEPGQKTDKLAGGVNVKELTKTLSGLLLPPQLSEDLSKGKEKSGSGKTSPKPEKETSSTSARGSSRNLLKLLPSDVSLDINENIDTILQLALNIGAVPLSKYINKSLKPTVEEIQMKLKEKGIEPGLKNIYDEFIADVNDDLAKIIKKSKNKTEPFTFKKELGVISEKCQSLQKRIINFEKMLAIILSEDINKKMETVLGLVLGKHNIEGPLSLYINNFLKPTVKKIQLENKKGIGFTQRDKYNNFIAEVDDSLVNIIEKSINNKTKAFALDVDNELDIISKLHQSLQTRISAFDIHSVNELTWWERLKQAFLSLLPESWQKPQTSTADNGFGSLVAKGNKILSVYGKDVVSVREERTKLQLENQAKEKPFWDQSTSKEVVSNKQLKNNAAIQPTPEETPRLKK